MVFRLYKYNNVTSLTAAMNNLASVAQSNGWTVDKQVTGSGDSGELYIHSSGNGNQNLYYSFNWYDGPWSNIANGSTLRDLRVCGNTGFNDSNTFDNQPGRWTDVTTQGLNVIPGGIPVTVPIITQYIFANQHAIIFFFDSEYLYSTTNCSAANHNASGRKVAHCYIGSIKHYNQNRTDGNALVQFVLSRYNYSYPCGNDGGLVTGLAGFAEVGYVNVHGVDSGWVLFENTVLAPQNGNIGLSTFYLFYTNYYAYPSGTFASGNIILEGIRTTSRKGLMYNMAQYNPYLRKAIFDKPIISALLNIGGYNYFFPIGELPYFVAPHYPDFVVGDEVYVGSRKFVMMPLCRYTESIGVAIEVEVE